MNCANNILFSSNVSGRQIRIYILTSITCIYIHTRLISLMGYIPFVPLGFTCNRACMSIILDKNKCMYLNFDIFILMTGIFASCQSNEIFIFNPQSQGFLSYSHLIGDKNWSFCMAIVHECEKKNGKIPNRKLRGH